MLGRNTFYQIQASSGYSQATIQRLFAYFHAHPPVINIQATHPCHLIIDGTYFAGNRCLIIYYDSDIRYTHLYRVSTHERYEELKKDLLTLKNHGLSIMSITCDGHRALLKAIHDVFPTMIVQRCLVHVQRMSLIYLTQRPKTEAGIELRSLVLWLHTITTHEKKQEWIRVFTTWCSRYEVFLREKSVNPLTTRHWYTHRKLRRTRSLILHALPNLFHYLDDPLIPKSTNGVESFFGILKNHLAIHRGLSSEHWSSYITWYLSLKNDKSFLSHTQH